MLSEPKLQGEYHYLRNLFFLLWPGNARPVPDKYVFANESLSGRAVRCKVWPLRNEPRDALCSNNSVRPIYYIQHMMRTIVQISSGRDKM